MATQITPLFGSIEQLEAELKEAKETGSYSRDIEYFQAVEFLLSYKGSKDTFTAYRREIEKLLLWSRLILKKSIKALGRAEIEDYIEFSKRPPDSWINDEGVDRFIDVAGQLKPNYKWRPFVNKKSTPYAPSDSSIRALIAIISSFFGFLIQQEYIFINPLSLIRQKKRFLKTKLERKKIRRISNVAKEYLIAEAKKMAALNPIVHERTLFIIEAFLAMYLRISEFTENHRWKPTMKDFYKDQKGKWWFYTVGKGNKERDIAVSDEMLEALKRYRLFLDLPPLPSFDEDIPLITKHKNGYGGIKSTRWIRSIVQDCFDQTIQALHRDGKVDEADEIKRATAHWLRHTGISEDVKKRPLEHVRDDAGHADISQTGQYVDTIRDERHESAKDKKI